MEQLIKLLKGLLVSCFLILFILMILMGAKSFNTVNDFGAYGSFVGGIIGTIFGGITVWLVFLTYNLQEKELKSTRDQLKQQGFETTFFNMLGLFHKISDSLISKDDFNNSCNILKAVYSGNKIDISTDRYFEAQKFILRAAYYHKKKMGDKGLTDEAVELLRIESLGGNELNDEVLSWKSQYESIKGHDEMERLFIEWIYEFLYDEVLEGRPGQYFRYIYSLITLIKETYPNEKQVQKKYVDLIQINLSSVQLTLLFYHCLTSLSSVTETDDKYFYNYLVEFGLTDFVDKRQLMNEDHCKFYHMNT